MGKGRQYFSPLWAGTILKLCYLTMGASGSAYAGIRTPRTSTTGAARSARFARIAGVGGGALGR